MLRVEALDAHYGRAHILHGVGFDVSAGAALVLLGRNGAGKSTTLKALIGLVRPTGGRVVLEGVDIAGTAPHLIARAGIGYVPEERRIFTDLTVLENLEVGRLPARPGLVPWTVDRVFALFPALGAMARRPGGRMSGGEQQMLAIGRTLMGNPRLILLDEPSEGLAPVIVAQLATAIRTMRAGGVTVLLAEQNLPFALAVADQVAILEQGRIGWTGETTALRADPALRQRWLAP